MKTKLLLAEPLLHFIALGAGLFGLFAWLNDDAMTSPSRIVIDNARVEGLRMQFESVRQRSPTDAELAGLIDNWVREEIYYREGLAMGLDRDDPVLRRQIAQKMAFVAENLGEIDVDENELRAWYEANSANYRVERRFGFRQRFFDPAAHGDALGSDIEAARALLAGGEDIAGDATLLPETVADATVDQIRRTFGDSFAETLSKLDSGRWSGPVESAYGLHLVSIDSIAPAHTPEYEDVRREVERDFQAERGREVEGAFYRALRARYEVSYGDDVQIAGIAE